MTDPFIGQSIGGCLLKKRIGQGGGGLVYLGSHPVFGENVVLKVLPRERREEEQARRRFEREIAMSAQLSHPGIVRVFHASTDTGHDYILMEYTGGLDVESSVLQSGVIPWKRAALITRQIADALAYAHGLGIIHRDIKPGNILLDAAGNHARLCDFGLAKDLNADSNLTQAGMILGTPNFMSPEQWFGAKDLTPQTDIYSLGATLFFMLTARKPFEGDSASAIMMASLFNTAPVPRDLEPGLPAGLSALVTRAMARDPQERFSGAPAMVSALDAILEKDSPGLFRRLFGKRH